MNSSSNYWIDSHTEQSERIKATWVPTNPKTFVDRLERNPLEISLLDVRGDCGRNADHSIGQSIAIRSILGHRQ